MKIPFMGPFIQALHPKFEGYLAQWASGPLSCVSVFHKYVPLSNDIYSGPQIPLKRFYSHFTLQIRRPGL